MVKKNAFLIGIILCAIILVPNEMNHVKAVVFLDPEVSEASEGCTMFGVRGTYYTDGQVALARVNEIRKEACDAGNVPDPRNKTRMLTSSDYVPMKWSKDLESIARIRAAEGGLAYGFLDSGHNRLNGKDIWSVTYNGIRSYGECLAYNNGTSLISGINQWYGEKNAWVNQTSGKVTGHYTQMIDPSNTYIGLGDFYTNASVYHNTLAGAFSSTSAALDSSFLPAYNDVVQKLEVKDSYIDSYYLEGSGTIYTGETESLIPRVRLLQDAKNVNLWLVEDVTFSSSAPSIASVDNNGLVMAKKSGNVTISVNRGNTVLTSIDIVVKCNHEKELKAIKQPTCTELGAKLYRCDVCDSEVSETVDMLPHSYEYGDTDSEGYCVGVCSGCGASIRIIPPTSYTLWWRNSVTTEGSSYWSVRPQDNPEGSVISCWINDINGGSDYKDMVVRSSDEAILSIKEKPSYTNIYDMEVKGTGIVMIDIYPLYNPKIKQTFTFRVGNQGAVDMEKTTVSLPKTEYIYSGTAHMPQPVVTYRECQLLSGTDYTISYENNTEAGTAIIKLTGKGLFSGTVSKTFEIKSGTGGDAENDEKPGTEGNAGNDEKPGTSGDAGNVDKPEIANNTEDYNKHEAPKEGEEIKTADGTAFVITDSKDGTHEVRYTKPSDNSGTNISIPDTVTINTVTYKVTSIDKEAFSGNKKITKVVIGKNVTRIGAKAFYNCKNLRKITIKSNKIKTVGKYSFKGISKNAVIKVPAKNYKLYKKFFGAKSGVRKSIKIKK